MIILPLPLLYTYNPSASHVNAPLICICAWSLLFPTGLDHRHLSFRIREEFPNLPSLFFSNLTHVPLDGKANLSKRTSDYVTAVIETFKQPLNKFKIKFKLLMMVHKVLHDLSPPYPFTPTICLTPPSSRGCGHPSSSSVSQSLILSFSPSEDLFMWTPSL